MSYCNSFTYNYTVNSLYENTVKTAEKHNIQFIGYDMYVSRVFIVTY